MLDAKEIDIEISRLEYGESGYPAYAKLADLYTIQNQMKKQEEPETVKYDNMYSAAPAAVSNIQTDILGEYGNSEFLKAVSGKDTADVLDIIDELMDTLHTVNPRVYNDVMRKIQRI